VHAGSGYRVPSLYERFGSFYSDQFGYSTSGNPFLKPERSAAFDAGIDQALFSERLRLSAVYYYTDIRDSIDFGFCVPQCLPGPDPLGRFSGYYNSEGGVARGVEASAEWKPTGSTTVELGAKGVVELQLISSGKTWGRGPEKDIHSSLHASVDSPVWRLVQALNTLVGPDGHTPAIEGWFEHVKPLTARQKEIIADGVAKTDEAEIKKTYGIRHWIGDEDFLTSQLRLASQPTVNIQGLVSGYMGPGGKTVLPGRAEAKLDLFRSIIRRDRRPTGISCRATLLTEPIVQELKANGLRVAAWTVDDLSRAAELTSWGVDAVTTHMPGEVHTLVTAAL
jgi:hypothetical protein